MEVLYEPKMPSQHRLIIYGLLSDQPKRYVKAFDLTYLMALGCPHPF